MNIKIKQATTQQGLKQCLSIRREVFVKAMGIDDKIEIDSFDSLSEKASVHFLLYCDDVPVATARMLYLEKGEVKLQRVAVLCEKRRKGLGKELVLFIESFAKEKGMKKVVLHSQYHAVGFYEKLGYNAVSDIFVEAGIEHIEMEKDI